MLPPKTWFSIHSRSPQGVVLHIWAQPRASKTQIVGLFGEPSRLKIQLAAPPVDGEANAELLSFLSKKLKIRKSDLALLRGEAGKSKDILCIGLKPENIQCLIA